MTYKKNIEFALFLIESLDSMHKIERVYPEGDSAEKEREYDEKHGITQHAYYTLDEGKAGVMHVFKRDKAYEIHHAMMDSGSGNEISGRMHGDSVKPNMKFVGTMHTVASRILKSGHAVRVVGNHTNGMFDTYNRIAHRLAKKHGKFVSAPKRYSLNSESSKDFSEITIHDTNPDSPLRDRRVHVMSAKNESNNYGLGFSQSWLNQKPNREVTVDELVEELLSYG